MNSIAFCTMGDSSFMPTMKLNINAIRHIYGNEADILVGDMGLSKEDKQLLRGKLCRIIDMPNLESDDVDFKLCCKPLFISKALDKSISSTMLVFMDADAIMVRKLNFFDLGGKDVAGVTTRESKDGRINSGVIFFDCMAQHFIADWTRKAMYNLWGGVGKLSEQDALIKLVDEGYYEVKELPCSQFNYTTVEDGIPDDVHIVHLKSKRRFNHDTINFVQDYIKQYS